MMNFPNHTADRGGVFMLYDTIELFQSESI